MSTSKTTKDLKTRAILITVFCVVLLSIGQALMKVGFKHSAVPSNLEFSVDFFKSFISSFFSTPWIFTGYFLATVSSILFLEALHNTEFGITAAVFRLNYIAAFCIGILYFGETFKTINLLGLLLIFLGVSFISATKNSKNSGTECSQ